MRGIFTSMVGAAVALSCILIMEDNPTGDYGFLVWPIIAGMLIFVIGLIDAAFSKNGKGK